MNADKSREYFSMYFEGTLDRGLREQFERALSQDAQVQAEYKAFVRTMQELEALKNPIPEPDFDLHERLSQRLDKHIYDLERQPRRGILSNWKKVAVAGLAGIALLAAAFSILNRGEGNTMNLVPGVGTKKATGRMKSSVDMTRVALVQTGDNWLFSYTADSNLSIEIQAEGEETKSASLAKNDVLESPLSNSGESAVVVEVRIDGVRHPIYVAIPGSERLVEVVADKGDLKAFAARVADLTGKPVMVAMDDVASTIEWKPITSASTITELAEFLKPIGYTIEERESGTIWLLP